MNFKKILLGLTTCSLCSFISLMATSAFAGGLSVREQSTSAQGASFAGNAAGYDLSTIFWNPAGVTIAGPGITTESHAALIIGDAELDPTGNHPLFSALPSGPNETGKNALIPSSYAAWRLTDKVTLGYAFNAPFGLSVEADNEGWAGQYNFREGEMKTFNFNPVVGYQVSPTLGLGVGLQVQYTELEFKQARLLNPFAPSVNDPTETIEGDDWSFGYTLGMLWRPVAGTSVGIGFRSRLKNKLEGTFVRPAGGALPAAVIPVEADLDLPEMVTVSLRQAIAPNMRLLGTFEWTNWSRFQTVQIIDKTTGLPTTSVTGANVEFEGNWDDGYFLSGGLEYDYSDQLTLRGGVAYEWSPVQEATQRLIAVPDNDRIWLSAGATYKWSEATSFDLAYTHIFIDDGDIEYGNGFTAESEGSVDIISLSFKTKWGEDGPLGLLSGLNN